MNEFDKRKVAFTGDFSGEFSNNVIAQTAREELVKLASFKKVMAKVIYHELNPIMYRISFYEKELNKMGFSFGKDLSIQEKEKVKELAAEEQEKFQELYEVHAFLRSLFNEFGLRKVVEVSING